MSRVIESETGAQLLPTREVVPLLGASWQAHLCADADLRARFLYWRELAAELQVMP